MYCAISPLFLSYFHNLEHLSRIQLRNCFPLFFRFAYSIFLKICSIYLMLRWPLVREHHGFWLQSTNCICMSYLLSIFAYAHCTLCSVLTTSSLCSLLDMKQPNHTHSLVLSRVNYFSCTKQKTNKKLFSVCISLYLSFGWQANM